MQDRVIRIMLILPFSIEFNPRKSAAQKSLLQTLSSFESIKVEILCISAHFEESEVTLKTLEAGRLYEKLLPKIINMVISVRIKRRIWQWVLKKILTAKITKMQFDLIYSNSMWGDTNIIANYVSRKTGIKYIIHEHRSQFARKLLGESIRIETNSLDDASLVFGLTGPHADAISKFTRHNVEVVPIAMLEEQCWIPNNRKSNKSEVAFFAWTNWRPLKKIDRLINAFLMVERVCARKLELYIAGPIPQESLSIEKIENIKKNHENIKFLGELSHFEIRKQLKITDFCVISSDHETLGLSALEALSCGVPVITTKCGGPEYFIHDGVNGIKVLEKNDEDLANAMLHGVNTNYNFNRVNIAKDTAHRYSVNQISKVVESNLLRII